MKFVTVALLLGFAGVLIGWDIYLYFNQPSETMITYVIWNGSKEHPVIPFITGFVAGHIFWGRGSK